MQLTVAHDFLPKTNSTRASIVMDHFGIDFEKGQHVVADDLWLPIEPGHVVLFTGASGSGKSSLMRAVTRQLDTLNAPQAAPINIDTLDLGDRILIDTLKLPVGEAMQLLSTCGLGEAHLMLRTPDELSDGQRYRFRLALALSKHPDWIIADEFTATLDRTLAKVIAFNIRRLADRTGTGFLLATTHEDVTTDLAPDVHVQCRLDGDVCVTPHASSDPAISNRADDDSADDSTVSKKKSRQLCRHPPHHHRDQDRLAVFRSVALSQPSHRADAILDALVARGRANRSMRVRVAAHLTTDAKPVLRP